MNQIRTEIIIKAQPEKIWQILMDFETYSQWNPFIISIRGQQRVGEQLVVRLLQPGGKPMTFKPIILKIADNKEFRWLGKLLIRGLFDGEHFFKLTANNDGTTTFSHGENFKGLLVKALSRFLKNTIRGFEEMNEALKKQCEQ